jgi:hypothetical protein
LLVESDDSQGADHNWSHENTRRENAEKMNKITGKVTTPLDIVEEKRDEDDVEISCERDREAETE